MINPADHVGLVKVKAREFALRHGLQASDIDDLIQDGMFGLMRACALFDPSHGRSFPSYAGQWIAATMRRNFAYTHDFFRVPILKYRKGYRVEKPLSLDAPTATESSDGTLHDVIGDESASPEERAAEKEQKDIIWNEVVAELTPRTRYILRRRFVDDATLEEVAKELGCVREWVRQLEVRALDLLRDRLRELEIA